MKLGLDFHGIIDAYPEQFAAIATGIMATGGDVYIITGNPNTEAFKAELSACGFHLGSQYNHIFSIQAYLEQKKCEYIIDSHGNKSFDPVLWNGAKGEYCKINDIDLHIDNDSIYGKYFETPFLLANNK